MQAHVNKVASRVLKKRPFPSRICHDQGDILFAQKRNEIAILERGMTHFQGVTQWTHGLCLCPRPPRHLCIVLAREASRCRRGPREQSEKRFQARAVVGKIWRQLPQDRTELFAQAQDPRGEKVCQRRVRVLQPPHVREKSARLDGKNKIRGSRFVPGMVILRSLQRIEGPVDLDRVDLSGCILEFALLGQSVRVEPTTPAGIPPAGDSDADSRPHPELTQRRSPIGIAPGDRSPCVSRPRLFGALPSAGLPACGRSRAPRAQPVPKLSFDFR